MAHYKAILFLSLIVASQAQISIVGKLKEPPGGPIRPPPPPPPDGGISDPVPFDPVVIVSPIHDIFPPPNNRCCNTHNIYSVDCSGSMWGTSWSKVNAYLSGNWGSSDYVSLFTHGGTWIGPVFQVTNYLTHQLNPALPGLPLPNGDTDYDDPINRAIQILNQGFPDRTCIHFISDGGE